MEGVDFVDTPKEIAAGKTYWFNVRYVNRGLAPATNLHMSEEVFIDKKDDLTTQRRLADLFEAKWKKVTRSSRIAVSGEESFQSANYTVSQQDLNRMANHEASFYVLSRMEYSDNQGRWRTDDCELFQNDETMGFTSSVRHWCAVFKNQRAPVPVDMQKRVAAQSGLHHQ